jgi:hypothetical protein
MGTRPSLGNQTGEGIEFFLLAITLAATLVLGGGGSLSLDRVSVRRVAAPGGQALR